MSDVHDHSDFSGDELLAAEYALGVLAGPDRAAAERRMARDRAFAALVAAWEQRLAPWAAEIAEVAPPPDMWDRIAAELPAQPPQRAGFWNSLAFWRGFGDCQRSRSSLPRGACLFWRHHAATALDRNRRKRRSPPVRCND